MIKFIKSYFTQTAKKKKNYLKLLTFNNCMKNKKEIDYEEYDRIVKKCRDISIRKNKNYGTSGLETFGTKGIIVRMNDKMSRLINLVWNEQEDYNDESVEDSLRDLLNYTIYCIMIKKGKLTIEANEDEL